MERQPLFVANDTQLLNSCIEAVAKARIGLGLSDMKPAPIDNLVVTYLAQTLLIGLHQSPDLEPQIAHPRLVFDALLTRSQRRQRQLLAHRYARLALWLHGLHLLGERASPSMYDDVAYTSRACYMSAGHQSYDDDLQRGLFFRLADHFDECSRTLGLGADHLGFRDTPRFGLT